MTRHCSRVWSRHFPIILALLAFSIASTSFGQSSGIEGTYNLTQRKLPDGTIVAPPAVMGTITFTRTQRSLNVFWKGANGKPGSYSVVATYKLTPTEYTETLWFNVFNDPDGSQGLAYDLSGETKSVAVHRDGGRIELKLPFDDVAVVFEGNKLTATVEGVFVDYWEKLR